MTVFKLPDLGEGLQEAEVVSWKVKEGDTIAEGEPMVEMSTAKAVVEVPSPFSGKIVKLHGAPGDVIKTGAALVTFALKGESAQPEAHEPEPHKTEAAKPAPAPAAGGGQVFKLPDLGEGLQEAEIVAWKVKEGETIKEGEPMVEMSTAKAVVEVPSPFTGKVAKLYGQPGDIIKTGAPLIAIAAVGGKTASAPKEEPVTEAKGDSGTVVGSVIVGSEITSDTRAGKDGISASPAVRALAKKLGVDLKGVKGTGAGGEVTLADVKGGSGMTAPAARPSGEINVSAAALATARALDIDINRVAPAEGRSTVTKGDVLAAARSQMGAPGAFGASKGVKAAPKVRALARERGIDLSAIQPGGPHGNVTMKDLAGDARPAPVAPPGPYQRPARPVAVSGKPEKVVGPRRVMAQAMAKANVEACQTSLFDQVSIARWGEGTDITVRLMRSVIAAAFAEPSLNAWFDGEKMEKTLHPHVNLGVAVDSPKGLFVPVVKGAEAMDGRSLRGELNRLRKVIEAGTIKAGEMSGGTITLSNFGMIAGRYATPIVLPPEVAIVGIGGLFQQLVMTEKGIENQRFMPVSLTFDHRACTGGEAARFLRAVLNDLALAF
jgi:2-oxoisovalerate dehydrogenase E2 component (dihydrolipoyl transacylase)